jgi:hypothetical protein
MKEDGNMGDDGFDEPAFSVRPHVQYYPAATWEKPEKNQALLT